MKAPAQAANPSQPLPDVAGVCTCGKRGYRAKAAAKAAAKRVVTYEGGGRLTVYRCAENLWWHIGHSSRGRRAVTPERRRRR